jgi:DNA modification methylase
VTAEPFYDDGQVSLYCADLQAVDLPGRSVAAVVTSPPYNVGVAYDTTPDALDWVAYRGLAYTTAELISRVLVEGAGPG